MTTQLDQILTHHQLHEFREAYRADPSMNQMAYASVAGTFLQAGPTEEMVIATWTTPRWQGAPVVGPATLPPPGTPINPVPSPMEGKDRERVIIALMTINMTSAATQPTPITNSATGEVDAGNWSVTASWAVPATAVSGVYLAHLVDQTNTSNEN